MVQSLKTVSNVAYTDNICDQLSPTTLQQQDVHKLLNRKL